MTDHDAERIVLTSESGRSLLAEVADIHRPGAVDLERWRKRADASLVHAAVRLAESRRRGAAKFARADRMWFSATGLEQATAEAVAIHKARRFADSVVVDLCCGVGGDTLAMAATSRGVIAVDRDPGMLQRCRWNAAVQGIGERVLTVRGDAEVFSIPDDARVHVDPDRRAVAGSKRAQTLQGYRPGLEFLAKLVGYQRGGAIKLGPASDFEAHFGGPEFEVEIISLHGECKEATVWFGDLARGRRTATTLPSGATWTERDGSGTASFSVLQPWIIDPDPALIRSGLLDCFASVHGWSRFAHGIDLMTTPEPTATPWGRSYRVTAALPLDLKMIRRELARRHIGRIDIKTRGTTHRPEVVRKQLLREGDQAATLFLIGGGSGYRAILTKPGE